ncbi:MAG TPA: HD domain-containing phosphohydrolase [Usitatibacter sp.]|nr:HD domain-containing phosphohydrolase [Usitatibacter sp.]
MRDIFKFFYSAGDASRTLQVSHLFVDLAQRSGLKAWLRKAKSYEGIAYADAGDIHSAVTAYAAALRISHEMADVRAEMYVLGNLGIALSYAGLYSEAMRCYERSFDLAMAAGDQSCASGAANNMAQACLHLGDYRAGIRHAERSIELGRKQSQQSLLSQAILECVYVQLALGIGQPNLADERLRHCEHLAASAGTPRARYIARIARGACEINHGNASKGMEALRDALAGTSGFNHERIECLMMLIRGLEQTGNVEQALFHVDELCAGLAKAYEDSMRALAESASEFPITAPHSDQLSLLSSRRLRLTAIAAERKVAQAQSELIERLSMAAQLKDDATGLHGLRVGNLSGLFAEHLEMASEAVASIKTAGRLHDIGKIAIPDTILRGPKERSSAERELLNAHASIGAGLLARSNVPELRCAEIVAKHHHERWDGEGYPARLKGKRIPLECRLVSLADAYDAMTHGRPHVKPMSASVALGEIDSQRGKQFDPELADAFIGFMRQLLAEPEELSRYLENSTAAITFSDSMRELGNLLAALPRGPQVPANRNGGRPSSRAPSRPSTHLREPL